MATVQLAAPIRKFTHPVIGVTLSHGQIVKVDKAQAAKLKPYIEKGVLKLTDDAETAEETVSTTEGNAEETTSTEETDSSANTTETTSSRRKPK